MLFVFVPRRSAFTIASVSGGPIPLYPQKPHGECEDENNALDAVKKPFQSHTSYLRNIELFVWISIEMP